MFQDQAILIAQKYVHQMDELGLTPILAIFQLYWAIYAVFPVLCFRSMTSQSEQWHQLLMESLQQELFSQYAQDFSFLSKVYTNAVINAYGTSEITFLQCAQNLAGIQTFGNYCLPIRHNYTTNKKCRLSFYCPILTNYSSYAKTAN